MIEVSDTPPAGSSPAPQPARSVRGPAPATPADRRRSLGELASDLPRNISDLVRAEIDSAKAELAAKAKATGIGVGLFAAAAFVLIFALGVFIAAGIAALALVLPLWASALIVGAALVVIAGILVLVGVGSLQRGMPPSPEKTMASVQEDIRTIKGIGKDAS